MRYHGKIVRDPRKHHAKRMNTQRAAGRGAKYHPDV